MPVALERKLKAQARKKGFKGKRAKRYIYGTLRKTGWVPSTQRRRGKPKTDAERRKTHQSRYGSSTLPPRGTGLRRK